VASCHFWCFNIRSDVMREMSDVWCFGNKSDVYWAIIFFSKFLYFLDENELVSKFLSLFHQFLTLMCVWYLFQTEDSLHSVGNNIYLMHKWQTFPFNDDSSLFRIHRGSRAYAREGFGVEPFLNFIFYENFITCAKEINCFRILFAC